uniref:Uncharacterized protein n=1 Tax=Arundo donax TaxID=35708 RepID=A0A0A8ZDB1_ARUDO
MNGRFIFSNIWAICSGKELPGEPRNGLGQIMHKVGYPLRTKVDYPEYIADSSGESCCALFAILKVQRSKDSEQCHSAQ